MADQAKEKRELVMAAKNARHAIADLIKEAEDVGDPNIMQALQNVMSVVNAVEGQIKEGPPPGAGPVPEAGPPPEDIPPELAAALGAPPEAAGPVGPPPSALEDLRAAFPSGPTGPEPLPPGVM